MTARITKLCLLRTISFQTVFSDLLKEWIIFPRPSEQQTGDVSKIDRTHILVRDRFVVTPE
jgi:hypothetical protein